MKITKRQLRRIIKEEKHRILKEQYSSAPTIAELLDDIAEVKEKLEALGEVLETGQTETPDQGGLSPEEGQSVHVFAVEALNSLSELEATLTDIEDDRQ